MGSKKTEKNKEQRAATGAVFGDWVRGMHESISEDESLKQAEPHECSEMSQKIPSEGREEFEKQSEPKKQPSSTESMEVCWYCMKSHSLNTPQLQMQLENKALMPPYGGDRLSYQQDPRPHFGVAHSSRSASFPLWGSEGLREKKKEVDEDDRNSISNCPHCHLGLPVDALRWHVEKCLLFEGPRNVM